MIDTDRLVSFTQDLVRQPSLPGEEKSVAERILGEMQALGFDQSWVDANGSVVGVIAGQQPGQTILLDAHCDTVGIAPGVPWDYDPHGAVIENGAIYGRGSADMKGALAAMMHAAASVDRAQIGGRVVVSATVMEEVLEGVSLKTVMDAVQPDFVVIGEATDLNLNRGGRGRAEIHLETIGRPGHSSRPDLAQNAVLDMMKVINAVEQMALPTDRLLGNAVMGLTDIISDPYPGYSVIPSRCRVTYDRRLLLNETHESVVGAITALPGLADVNLNVSIAEGEHTAYTGVTLHSQKFFPAWAFPETHPLIQRALAGLQTAGLAPQVGAYQFCTNGAYSAGIAGVPTIGFGPAQESDAHIVNERLSLDALTAAAQGYRGIIESTSVA